MDITELLAFSHKQGASDLHLSAGLPPMIRVDGDIRRINVPALDSKEVYGLIYEIMNDKQRKEFEEFLECDFSFEIPGIARFRVNAYNQNRGAGGVFRTIPSKVLTMEDLGMGDVFSKIAQSTRGLITVTGPTGSGKSTTLAAMMDYVNANRYQHILTIEDPIEFVHESKKSLVNQREVHRDTLGFNEALRSALREDPDIILVGEMRDMETIRLALEAAETGHVVLEPCTRRLPQKRSIVSLTCSRRLKKRWCDQCYLNHCKPLSRRICLKKWVAAAWLRMKSCYAPPRFVISFERIKWLRCIPRFRPAVSWECKPWISASKIYWRKD